MNALVSVGGEFGSLHSLDAPTTSRNLQRDLRGGILRTSGREVRVGKPRQCITCRRTRIAAAVLGLLLFCYYWCCFCSLCRCCYECRCGWLLFVCLHCCWFLGAVDVADRVQGPRDRKGRGGFRYLTPIGRPWIRLVVDLLL